MKHCNSCPIDIHTEQGVLANAYGCLPSYYEVKKWYLETGKVWACHDNPKQPCIGLLKNLKRDGIKVSVNKDTVLITEKTTLEEIYGSTN